MAWRRSRALAPAYSKPETEARTILQVKSSTSVEVIRGHSSVRCARRPIKHPARWPCHLLCPDLHLLVRSDQEVQISTDPAHRHAIAARLLLEASRRRPGCVMLASAERGTPRSRVGHQSPSESPGAIGMRFALDGGRQVETAEHRHGGDDRRLAPDGPSAAAAARLSASLTRAAPSHQGCHRRRCHDRVCRHGPCWPAMPDMVQEEHLTIIGRGARPCRNAHEVRHI
jgi:hypothetical protein